MRKNLWENFEKRIRPKKLSKKQERQWDLLMFLFRLLVLSVPLYILLSIEGVFYYAQIFNANITAFILNAIGIFTTQDGVMLTIVDPNSPFRFIISEDCTGWKSIMFLFALIFAVKGPKISSRVRGLLGGSLIIFVANVARILGTVFAERAWGTNTALLVHDYLFRFGLVVLVLLLWVGWLVYLNKKSKKKT
jgi:exosortase/archaeosortase family protein